MKACKGLAFVGGFISLCPLSLSISLSLSLSVTVSLVKCLAWGQLLLLLRLPLDSVPLVRGTCGAPGPDGRPLGTRGDRTAARGHGQYLCQGDVS